MADVKDEKRTKATLEHAVIRRLKDLINTMDSFAAQYQKNQESMLSRISPANFDDHARGYFHTSKISGILKTAKEDYDQTGNLENLKGTIQSCRQQLINLNFSKPETLNSNSLSSFGFFALNTGPKVVNYRLFQFLEKLKILEGINQTPTSEKTLII
jgi:hypothetical protein